MKKPFAAVNGFFFIFGKWKKHYKMYDFDNKEAAYQFALDISNKLNIDLLDATEKGNFVWIEKENLK